MGTEPVVVQACCLHCQQVRDYHPSAARLTLFANTAIILEYFCLACHGYNKQRLLDTGVAQEMTAGDDRGR